MMKIKRADIIWPLNNTDGWYVEVKEPTRTVHVVDGEVSVLPLFTKNDELFKAARADLESVGYELSPGFDLDILPVDCVE